MGLCKRRKFSHKRRYNRLEEGEECEQDDYSGYTTSESEDKFDVRQKI